MISLLGLIFVSLVLGEHNICILKCIYIFQGWMLDKVREILFSVMEVVIVDIVKFVFGYCDNIWTLNVSKKFSMLYRRLRPVTCSDHLYAVSGHFIRDIFPWTINYNIIFICLKQTWKADISKISESYSNDCFPLKMKNVKNLRISMERQITVIPHMRVNVKYLCKV